MEHLVTTDHDNPNVDNALTIRNAKETQSW